MKIFKKNPKEWMEEKIKEAEGDTSLVYPLYLQFKKETGSEMSQSSFRRTVRKYKDSLLRNSEIEYDDPELARLSAQKQKQLDTNRILRKEIREESRLYNFLDSLYQEYLEVIPKADLSNIKIKSNKSVKSKYGILHLSDTHLNEHISDFENVDNEYDFLIASKRLKKFVTESISIFKSKGVTDVVVIITGDLMNSTRRLSEKAVQITSLAVASIIATSLLSQVIIELAQYFTVTFGGVCGNESRIGDSRNFDQEWMLLSENWDYVIYENLRIMFKDSKIECMNGDIKEKVFKLKNGFRGLFLHGDNFSATNPEKTIREYISKYTTKGTPIHGVFFGHIHSTFISNWYARSASLCGGNPYSFKKLGFYSRASQNIYIVSDKGDSFNGMAIDLQDVDGIEGYNITEELKRYNIGTVERQSNTKVTIEYLV